MSLTGIMVFAAPTTRAKIGVAVLLIVVLSRLEAAGELSSGKADSIRDSTAGPASTLLNRSLARESCQIYFDLESLPRLVDPIILKLGDPGIAVTVLANTRDTGVTLESVRSEVERMITASLESVAETLNVVHVGGLVQTISLDRNTYRQGEIAFLNVTTTLPIANVSVKFLYRTYRLYARSQTLYQTILAVPMDADSGRHKMTLAYEESGESKSVKLPFFIMPGSFADQDTSEMDVGVLTEETLEMLKYEGRYFTRAYGKDTAAVLYDGDFIVPARGSVSAVYGMPRKYNKDLDKWSHKGIDIANGIGTEVVASNSGVVVMTEYLDGHGNSIVISHGQGIHTVYLHLSKILVKKGARVVKGQPIAKIGATGICTGPNLHWQIMLNRVATDPRSWLKDGGKIVKGSVVKPELPEEKQSASSK